MDPITLGEQRAGSVPRETEERFRKLADTTPVILWIKDTEHRVTFINRAGAEFFGVPVERLTRDGWRSLMHPDDRECADAVYYAAVDRQANDQVEFRARRADGEYRHILATTGPRYVDGNYVGQAGTLIDITDLKRRQEDDLARQKLESLGTLAGGIAHDFNNLLGAVITQTELALSNCAEGTSAEGALRSILDVAMRGAEIVRELMTYAGQEETELELVNVTCLIEETLELLKVVASKRAALQFHPAEDAPSVLASPGMLRQLLINLITNASEAIGERDGMIKVGTSRVNVQGGALPQGEYLQLEVSDTGRGIAPENKDRIFDPFFSTKSPGRGLGLAVVQGIVKRLGGLITVRSAEGYGSTFQVLLPGTGDRVGFADTSRRAAEEVSIAARGAILLVEDEEAVRVGLARLLRNTGFTVLDAAEGSEAIGILKNHAAELTAMILDVTLPGLPSGEILQEAERLCPHLRVIVTSGYSEQRVASMFSELEGRSFLQKPYRLANILRLLA